MAAEFGGGEGKGIEGHAAAAAVVQLDRVIVVAGRAFHLEGFLSYALPPGNAPACLGASRGTCLSEGVGRCQEHGTIGKIVQRTVARFSNGVLDISQTVSANSKKIPIQCLGIRQTVSDNSATACGQFCHSFCQIYSHHWRENCRDTVETIRPTGCWIISNLSQAVTEILPQAATEAHSKLKKSFFANC